MQIRRIRPDEYEALGRITLDAYRRADTGETSFLSPQYEAELADVATRDAVAVVLVAVDVDGPGPGRLLGGLTFVPPGASPLTEHGEHDMASIRMLAVADDAQGRGVGRALTEAAIHAARDAGAAGILLHSTVPMTTAHRLYERLGWVRDPSLDWEPEPGVPLLGFRLTF